MNESSHSRKRGRDETNDVIEPLFKQKNLEISSQDDILDREDPHFDQMTDISPSQSPNQSPGNNLSKRQRQRKNRKERQKLANQFSITCNLPDSCSVTPVTFHSHTDYDMHFDTEHSHTCLECDKIFPCNKLLDIHITENHDPFAKIKLQRGDPIFACFDANCERVFKDHRKRRLHLIDKHNYPKDFIFSIIDKGIKNGDTSLIKVRKEYGIWKSV